MAAERHAQQQAERPRVVSPEGARDLANATIELMSQLADVLDTETGLVRDGRIGEALAHEPQKTDLAGRYMRALEVIKANAVALARFAPEDVNRLKVAHAQFTGIIESNHAVLATARAVSESIVRDLARDSGRTTQPQGYRPPGYGAPAAAARPSAGPIVVSRKL
jgi:hypothetical protein